MPTLTRTSRPPRTRRAGARPTQAERRAASEERLLAAAMELVATRGTARTSLGDIAATAGCSRGLPTYLFGSKDQLLLALADYLVERFRTELFEPALQGREGLPALLTWLRVYVEGLRRPEPQVRAACVLLGEAVASEPAFLPAINRVHRTVRSMVAEYVRDGIERAEIRSDVDPEAHAALLIGTLRGISLLAVTDPSSLDLDRVGRELVAATRRSLRAAAEPGEDA
ncbi:MAG TPA: TetR/AcrR family transcriptional regulator [Acidimicrobiia bacterium]|nr:TetR/AcrR family transcriptional regulator [Acidimicrobiia bacterium]